MAAVKFVTEQPTGMLVVGGAVIAAGGRELMVFDMLAKVATDQPPPLLGTCGAVCTPVGIEPGQNFHSVAYRKQGKEKRRAERERDNVSEEGL